MEAYTRKHIEAYRSIQKHIQGNTCKSRTSHKEVAEEENGNLSAFYLTGVNYVPIVHETNNKTTSSTKRKNDRSESFKKTDLK